MNYKSFDFCLDIKILMIIIEILKMFDSTFEIFLTKQKIYNKINTPGQTNTRLIQVKICTEIKLESNISNISILETKFKIVVIQSLI